MHALCHTHCTVHCVHWVETSARARQTHTQGRPCVFPEGQSAQETRRGVNNPLRAIHLQWHGNRILLFRRSGFRSRSRMSSAGLEKLRMTGAGRAIAALTSGGDAQGEAAADAGPLTTAYRYHAFTQMMQDTGTLSGLYRQQCLFMWWDLYEIRFLCDWHWNETHLHCHLVSCRLS